MLLDKCLLREICWFEMFNPFVSNAPFFHPLETSENFMVFGGFQGVEKGCTGNEWVHEVVTENYHYNLQDQPYTLQLHINFNCTKRMCSIIAFSHFLLF